ncbi:MAG: TldD/PmbA family protein [Clostridia bacterium]|nr:TldD/PmbA family protein [Clostridia bacterium]
MDINLFIDRLFEKAKEEQFEAAEVWVGESEAFSVKCIEGSIDDYKVSRSGGLGLRALVNGKMGYASTQAYDDDAIMQLIDGVRESAELNESPEQDEIYAGDSEYPTIKKDATDIFTVTPEEKIAAAERMDAAVLTCDSRITKTKGSVVSTGTGRTLLRNTYGLCLEDSAAYCVAYTGAVAPRGDSVVSAYDMGCGLSFGELDPEQIARNAVRRTIDQLDAAPVSAGEYRIIFEREAMCDLLQTFCGIFSAENAQRKLSLLQGKEGEKIASDAVTLVDDPLMKGGYATSAFDAEGSAARTKAVIENGVLKTLLHSRKTARIQGVETTGNASRAGYASPITVAPTNFYFKPGEKTLDGLQQQMGDGLVILEISGLHAGANAVSGDFSLLAKGYAVKDGKRTHAVEQITIAGNFYRVLENIREVGSDLLFPGSGIGSPSVDVGTLVVSA